MGETDAWFISIVQMVATPFVLGGAAFWYVARWGKKAAKPPS